MLEQCGFVSWRQQDSAAVGREHSRTKKDRVHFENEGMGMGKLHFKNKKA